MLDAINLQHLTKDSDSPLENYKDCINKIVCSQPSENLEDGEIVISFDFAENYAFVIQNSAQSFHWNNNQATISIIIVYYRENDDLKHESVAII